MSHDADPSSRVRYEIKNGVAHVTLNRPKAMNALDLESIALLRKIVDEIEQSDTVRSVLLTGAGRAFSAGGDVKSMLEAIGPSREGAHLARATMEDGLGQLHPMLATLYRLPKPVIAAVNGVAAGAGVGLALAADITWASSSASFTLAFTAIGVSPDSGTTFHLPRIVGPKLAAELFLTNRQLTSREALDAGLVSRVFPDDELLGRAREIAERLAEGPTQAFARSKHLWQASGGNDFETHLENERQEVGRSVMTQDFGEGLKAFVEKRRPEFRGE